MSGFWGEHALETGGCLHGRLDHLALWVGRTPAEWLVAHRREAVAADTPAVELGAPPDGVNWHRFAGAADRTRVQLVPAMPDRPVLVRPVDALCLLPGHTAQFFVGIPVSVCVGFATKPTETVLAAVPSEPLPKSWFGEPDDDAGVLCYALRSRARHLLGELAASERGRAICALSVANNSGGIFEFDRICLRTLHLGIFAGADGRLWTTAVTAVFRGAGHDARLSYGTGAPPGATDARRLAPAREPAAESLSARVFGGWRELI